MNAIVEILRARAARGSRAPHGDGARIALAVEGGAMRGVISAGMVSALEHLGMVDAFDAVYGSSAGAINAAYFLAGQATLGSRIYFEDINNARFISLARAFGPRPVVNLGFLLEDVATRTKPLDVDRVLGARSPLAVLVTDVQARSSRVLDQFGSGPRLLEALRASATMPVLAGAPREYDGRRYLDASLSEPIPVPTAEAHGHSHILALLTRSGEMRARPSAFDRYFIAPRLRRLSPELAASYLDRARPYSKLLEALNAGTGPLGRSQVLSIRTDARIGKLERGRETLEAGARRGYDAVMATFST